LIRNHLCDWGLRQQPLLCSIYLDPEKTNHLKG
jgi:dolichyl-phosphate-mannose--protein O-mannosyl transferase